MKKKIVLLSFLLTFFIVYGQGVSTFAGSGAAGYLDGNGTTSQFNKPWGIAIDASGNVYISDSYNHRIRKISPSGIVSTFAGSGVAGFSNGTGNTAQFNFPSGLFCDGSGNIYVADTQNNRIRKITTSGVVTTIAGSGTAGFSDGTGNTAQFNLPYGICCDGSGNIYVADTKNNRIRKITTSGVVTTIAGSGTAGFLDGKNINANFNNPQGLCVNSIGDIYVADTENNKIRKIATSGDVSTLSGNGSCGDIVNKSICRPTSITIDKIGNFFVSTTGVNQNKILKIYSYGYGKDFIGYGFSGYKDGWGVDSRFSSPTGICLNNSGNYLFVADLNNNRIRKVLVCNVTAKLNYSVDNNLCKSISTPQLAVLTGNGAYTGGTFSSTSGLTINTSTGEINPSTSTPGTYIVSYNINSTTECMESPTLTQVTITPIPTASITYSEIEFCNDLDNQVVNLTGTGAYTGGVYSSTNGLSINSSTGEINPSLSNPGKYTVNYSTPTNLGCSAINTTTKVTITALPTANISYSGSPFCKSLTSVKATTSGSGAYLGGIYTSTTGLSINPSTGSINPSLSEDGTYTITYEIQRSGGCYEVSTTTDVDILPEPTTNISVDGTTSNVTTITNGNVVQLQFNTSFGTPANIQWSPNIGISSTSIANPLVYPTSTTTYTASFLNTNGCQQSSSITVNVNTLPNIGNLSISSPNTSVGIFDTLTVNVQLNNAKDVYSLYMKLKGNSDVNQYLNYLGYTAGTLLGTSNIISTPPTVTNGVPDFGMTKVGAAPGYTGSGLFYSFRFVPKNNTIPSGTSFCFYLDDVNAYNSAATTCGITNQGQFCLNFTNQVKVWPGDLNNSKMVTTADLLPIGYFYNSTGPARQNATIQWTEQPATLWGYNHSSKNGDAYKVFADSNGDGIINNADQAAIGYNLNKKRKAIDKPFGINPPITHKKSRAVGVLNVTPNNSIINPKSLPQTITFNISLTNTGSLNSLYGISVNLIFNDTIFDLSTATIDYTGSIFGNIGTDCLAMNFNSSNGISVGLTRYANAPIYGQGLLFKITIQTKSTLPNLTQTKVMAYVDAANNQLGDELTIQDAPTTNLTINNNNNSLSIEELILEDISLYPNPTNDIIHLVFKNNVSEINNLKLKVFNSVGQLVDEKNIQNNTIDISTKNWGENGVYFVQLVN